MRILRATLCMLVLVVSLAARAQPADRADKEGFVPVQAGEQLGPGETLPGGRMVGYAYGVILAVLVTWVASVAVRSRRVEEELARLRAQIEKGGKG